MEEDYYDELDMDYDPYEYDDYYPDEEVEEPDSSLTYEQLEEMEVRSAIFRVEEQVRLALMLKEILKDY